tara:strand:+ start:349 stop:666 length:318 start_codon:yes stop_codon:yes gene_type:complete
MTKIAINDIVREMTAEEQAAYDARQQAYIDDGPNRKLTQIKEIRLEKLQETDWWVISEQITDAQKTWRQNLRNLPQDYTDEASYDLLLARDPDTKELTHSIWNKP